MVFEKIREMLANQLEVDETEITLDTHILNDLDADSLDVVELMMAVEEEYDIFIEDDELEGILTVRQVVEFVEGKLKQ